MLALTGAIERDISQAGENVEGATSDWKSIESNAFLRPSNLQDPPQEPTPCNWLTCSARLHRADMSAWRFSEIGSDIHFGCCLCNSTNFPVSFLPWKKTRGRYERWVGARSGYSASWRLTPLLAQRKRQG